MTALDFEATFLSVSSDWSDSNDSCDSSDISDISAFSKKKIP